MKLAFLNDGIYAYASGLPCAVGGAERQQLLLARARHQCRLGRDSGCPRHDEAWGAETHQRSRIRWHRSGPNTFGVVSVFIIGAAGLVVLAVRLSPMGRCSRALRVLPVCARYFQQRWIVTSILVTRFFGDLAGGRSTRGGFHEPIGFLFSIEGSYPGCRSAGSRKPMLFLVSPDNRVLLRLIGNAKSTWHGLQFYAKLKGLTFSLKSPAKRPTFVLWLVVVRVPLCPRPVTANES